MQSDGFAMLETYIIEITDMVRGSGGPVFSFYPNLRDD